MKKLLAALIFVATWGSWTPVQAATKVISQQKMTFENCLSVIRKTASKLGVSPNNIVETDILRIVRFPTNDGSGQSLLVTCSKLDEKMVINISD